MALFVEYCEVLVYSHFSSKNQDSLLAGHVTVTCSVKPQHTVPALREESAERGHRRSKPHGTPPHFAK